jgi:hypothetical protein
MHDIVPSLGAECHKKQINLLKVYAAVYTDCYTSAVFDLGLVVWSKVNNPQSAKVRGFFLLATGTIIRNASFDLTFKAK